MRPIPKSFIVVVLVGYFAMAVGTAEEVRCNGPFKGLTLTSEEIETVLRHHQAWLASDRQQDDERRANLCQANLQEADLHNANLQEAILYQTNLHKANLVQANLQKAILIEVNLQEAFLVEANLQESRLDLANLRMANLTKVSLQKAYLYQAHLQWAFLAETNLQEANLFKANLQGVFYEPIPGTLPAFWTLTDSRNHLETLGFRRSPAGLIALREAFKKGGDAHSGAPADLCHRTHQAASSMGPLLG